MARKNRNLAGFDEVASTNNNNVNVNKNDNEEINVNDDVKIDANDNVNHNDDKNVNMDANIDNGINVSDNNDANVNVEEPKEDYLDKLIEGKAKRTESDKNLTGIYLEKDLSQILDRLAKKGGRGAKSRIVNEALRSVFKKKGLI